MPPTDSQPTSGTVVDLMAALRASVAAAKASASEAEAPEPEPVAKPKTPAASKAGSKRVAANRAGAKRTRKTA